LQIIFHNRIIVVAGGASGIGKACCQLFLEGGAEVLILVLADKGDDLAFKEQVNLHFYACDLSNSVQISHTFRKIKDRFGGIDVLVNNAGILTYGNHEELNEQTWDYTLDVNVKACFLCAHHALPLLRNSASPVIINIASVKTQVCQNNELAYTTSKVAIPGLSRSIATDYAPFLRCLTVSPGAVDTPLLRDEIAAHEYSELLLRETEEVHLLRRLASPNEVANLVYFMASDKASFITGHEYRVDGGIEIKIQEHE
jgi:NAD(P)-dependent dehydrogenase (short-subunit alcohol dehydrogenase family)